MRLAQNIVAIAIIPALFTCCHKTSAALTAPASLNIVNAIPTSQPIIPVLGSHDTITYFQSAQSIGYSGSFEYSPLSGTEFLYIVQASDTTPYDISKQPLFAGTLDLAAGRIYSLFLAGDTSSVDTLFVIDNIPHYSDSVAGIRFVNLAKGSQPISVSIQGSATTEFNNLNYKAITDFKQYPTMADVGGSYTFQIQNQSNDSILLIYSWNYALFKNTTLVIAGSEESGSSSPLTVFSVNNY